MSSLESTHRCFPEEIDEPLLNPHKGWVLIDHATREQIDAGASVGQVKDGTAYKWYAGVAVMSTWGEVEREEGVLDWSFVDRAIEYWAKQGKHIHLRFSTEQFGRYAGCPEWLYAKGVPRQSGPRNYSYPDYNNQTYQAVLRRFMASFAARFCEDQRIETIDLRAYGNWGEWHSGYRYETLEERLRALCSLVSIWREANRGRKLLNLSVSWEWQTRYNTGRATLPVGLAHNDFYQPTFYDYLHNSGFDLFLPLPDVSIRRDGVAGCIIQKYDGRLIANFFETWRKPIFAEFFGGIDRHAARLPESKRTPENVRPIITNAVDDIINQHPNFSSPFGWGSFLGATEFYNDHLELVKAGHKQMGYRFVLTKVEFPKAVAPGETISIRHAWQNRAQGRCYRPYTLVFYLMRAGKVVCKQEDPGLNPTCMVSGSNYDFVSSFNVPKGLSEGDYELRLALVDEKGHPAIKLAIGEEVAENLYSLGSLIVKKGERALPSFGRNMAMEREGQRWVSESELEPNSFYQISFTYEIEADAECDLFTDYPGFCRFHVQGDDQQPLGETRWFEKAGQGLAHSTYFVETGSAQGYRVMIEAVGGGSILVKGVRCEQIAATRVACLSDPLAEEGVLKLGAGARRFEHYRICAKRDRSQIELPIDRWDFLSTNPGVSPLRPNTSYTIWFHCALVPQYWESDNTSSVEVASKGAYGDYAYLRLHRDGSGQETGAEFRWVQRHTTNPLRRAYTFRTGSGDGWQLTWGLKNGGECQLAHIYLVNEG